MTLIIWWVLPSLITLLLMFDGGRRYKECPVNIEDYKSDDWAPVIIFSLIWPIGMIGYFFIIIWPILIKERGKK